MPAGQISDYTGAAALLDSLPAAQWMLADRGYDADWFRDALEEKGIKPCIPGQITRGRPVKYDKRKYKRRNRIEIMFGRLKDWRRVATRYDRCPTVFFSAICLTVTVMFCLRGLSPEHAALSLLKTHNENHHPEPSIPAYEPKIRQKGLQSTVLRTLQRKINLVKDLIRILAHISRKTSLKVRHESGGLGKS